MRDRQSLLSVPWGPEWPATIYSDFSATVDPVVVGSFEDAPLLLL